MGAALTLLSAVQAWLLWRLSRMVAASARLEEKVGHLGDALSILTETSEAGFKAIADELTRRAVSRRRRRRGRRRRSRGSSAAARRGTSIADIAAAEHMSEGEVRLRLHLAEHAAGVAQADQGHGRTRRCAARMRRAPAGRPAFLASRPGRGVVLDEAWYCSRPCLEAETRDRHRARAGPRRRGAWASARTCRGSARCSCIAS